MFAVRPSTTYGCCAAHYKLDIADMTMTMIMMISSDAYHHVCCNNHVYHVWQAAR